MEGVLIRWREEDNSTNNNNHTRGDVDENSVIPLIILISLLTVFSLIATHFLLQHFARIDTPFVMKALVGTSWFMGLAGVLVLLPADLVGEFYNVGATFIVYSWRVVYWVTFFLAWIICPIAMEYHAAGGFTFQSRLCEAIIINLKIYVLLGVILIILGIVLALARGLNLAFVLALVNFYGMFLIVVMLGYGLVEVPMAIWRSANLSRALESQEFRAGGVETRMIDAEDQVDEAVEEIVSFRRRLGRSEDELIKLCDKVLEKAPRRDSTINTSTSSTSGGRSRGNTTDTSVKLNKSTLATLNRKLKRALVAAERARWDWDDLLERTTYLERLLHDRRRIDPTAAAVVIGSDTAEAPPTQDEEEEEISIQHDHSIFRKMRRSCTGCLDQIRLRGYTHFYHFAAFITGIASLVLLWCCVISPFSIELSVFGLMVNSAGSMVTVFLYSFLPLFYMSTCVYTALFKFKYLDVLALHGNRQTDAYNLLYNASYMGRLQFSLGVVYFQMLYPQDSTHTAFHDLVGDMDTVPLLGKSFNQYSPFFILFFSFSSLFNCGDRFLDFIGINTHRKPRRGNREHEERIEEGRRLIAAARARRERERRRMQQIGDRGRQQLQQQLQQQQQQQIGGGNGSISAAASRDGGYARVEDLLERL